MAAGTLLALACLAGRPWCPLPLCDQPPQCMRQQSSRPGPPGWVELRGWDLLWPTVPTGHRVPTERGCVGSCRLVGGCGAVVWAKRSSECHVKANASAALAAGRLFSSPGFTTWIQTAVWSRYACTSADFRRPRFPPGLGVEHLCSSGVAHQAVTNSGPSYVRQRLAALLQSLRTRARTKLIVATLGASVSAPGVLLPGELSWWPFGRTYGELVALWLRWRFPWVNVVFRNVAHGGCTSVYMFYCHDLEGDEDLVFLDFLIPDSFRLLGHQHYAALARTVLSFPSQPAVVALGFAVNESLALQRPMRNEGMQRAVATELGLPFVSFRAGAKWLADRQITTHYFRDPVHMNHFGHVATACWIVRGLLDTAQPSLSHLHKALAVPPPSGGHALGSMRRHCTTMLDGTHGRPTVLGHTDGWAVVERRKRDRAASTRLYLEGATTFGTVKRCWQSATPGSALVLGVPPSLSAVLVFYGGPGPMGTVELQVDDGDPWLVDLWSEGWQNRGVHELVTLFTRSTVAARQHRVRLVVSHKRNVSSTGHEVQLIAILYSD